MVRNLALEDIFLTKADRDNGHGMRKPLGHGEAIPSLLFQLSKPSTRTSNSPNWRQSPSFTKKQGDVVASRGDYFSDLCHVAGV
jgi:hypothetical protein